MAMNREQRRYLQRQGQMDSDGNAVAQKREPRQTTAVKDRATPLEYASGVRTEMRKVSWPTRNETVNYTIVVALTFAFVTALVAGLDWVFAKGILEVLRLSDNG